MFIKYKMKNESSQIERNIHKYVINQRQLHKIICFIREIDTSMYILHFKRKKCEK